MFDLDPKMATTKGVSLLSENDGMQKAALEEAKKLQKLVDRLNTDIADFMISYPNTGISVAVKNVSAPDSHVGGAPLQEIELTIFARLSPLI